MAKRFKLRISRVMTSFQTCNSKDPSTLPSDPIPSFLLQLSSPTKPHHHRSSFKRHVSSAFTSTGCGLCSNKNSHTRSQPEFKWQKEDKWHVVAIKAYNNDEDDDNIPRQKIYNSSASGHSSDDLFPPPPPPPPPPTMVAAQKKLRIRKKKTTGGGVRLRISTSSAETGLFSSEADEPGSEEESETLVSTSRSLSTSDSSNPTSRRKPKTKKKKSYKRREKSRGRESGVGGGGGGSGGESPARLSVFKRLIPCGVLEGKVKESYAVVKKSEDPKEDFKRSMMEMVVEKQMFEERELEQLLECFLSLNSRQHHGVIVEAFSEIWEALFSTSTVKKKKSSTASAAPPPVSSASLNKC